ncbi:alpha-amylase family glycosyl hydrolase [Paenibacillus wynnii]|uniref:alpha-amylase family glycosyl hydrolase n=1 Tax=Paenibacillus wynnii TaxID=268407 RepID=UPI002793470D|nr:alpha-amylase family glycosyl hydrolase [Paenibacillus wynnii]MDQ0195558.1 1,4-alpha-glucan branching enzyme [Paenibacillus wynnii]
MSAFPIQGSHGVRFEYFTDKYVKSVAVAGTFNHWNGDRNYMIPKEDSRGWEIEIPITKGRHLYKLVVDGEAWIIDPLNPNVSEDGQNNSSFTVTEHGEVLIRTNAISKEHPGYMYNHFKAIESPEWIQKAVIYQLHSRAFTDNGFRGLSEKIDYFKDMGINTLWLMPFHEVGVQGRIGEYGDPYAVKDFYSIDPTFGTKEDLSTFISKAHANGIKVIMDWVLNRTSVDHILTSSHPEYFTRNDQGEIYYDVPGRDYFAGIEFRSCEIREYVIEAMKYWVVEFDFDGIRLDDSDITPYDFLVEIKHALQVVKEDLILISQAYDEYHHIEACNLTYDGNPRILVREMMDGTLTQSDFIAIYNSYKYSFPKHALRMSWLEEKERSRAVDFFGEKGAGPAASILLTLEGVPCLMMGQEFNENTLETWASLFDEYKLNWNSFDAEMFEHYKFLIHLRTNNPAFWMGDLEFIPNSEDKVLSYMRHHEDSSYLVVVNVSADALFVSFEKDTLSKMIEDKTQVTLCTKSGDRPSGEDLSNLWICSYETIIYKIKGFR